MNNIIHYQQNTQNQGYLSPQQQPQRQQPVQLQNQRPNQHTSYYIKDNTNNNAITAHNRQISAPFQQATAQLVNQRNYTQASPQSQQQQHQQNYNILSQQQQQPNTNPTLPTNTAERITITKNLPYNFQTNSKQGWDQINNSRPINEVTKDAALLTNYSTQYLQNRSNIQALQEEQQKRSINRQQQQQSIIPTTTTTTTVAKNTTTTTNNNDFAAPYNMTTTQVSADKQYDISKFLVSPENRVNTQQASYQPQQQQQQSIVKHSKQLLTEPSYSQVETVKRHIAAPKNITPTTHQYQIDSKYTPDSTTNYLAKKSSYTIQKPEIKQSNNYSSIIPSTQVYTTNNNTQNKSYITPQNNDTTQQNYKKIEPVTSNYTQKITSNNYTPSYQQKQQDQQFQEETVKRHIKTNTNEEKKKDSNPFFIQTDSGRISYKQQYKELINKYSPQKTDQQQKSYFQNDYVPKSPSPRQKQLSQSKYYHTPITNNFTSITSNNNNNNSSNSPSAAVQAILDSNKYKLQSPRSKEQQKSPKKDLQLFTAKKQSQEIDQYLDSYNKKLNSILRSSSSKNQLPCQSPKSKQDNNNLVSPNGPDVRPELTLVQKDSVKFARIPRTEKTMKLLDKKKLRSLPQNKVVDKSKYQVILGNFGYNYKDFLGQGSFGTVYKGTNLQNGQEVAIKQMDNSMFINSKAKESLQAEIKVMKELKSANVVKMFDVIPDARHTNIILELCTDGDLEGVLEKKHRLDEETATQILFQILQGFKDLLNHGYIHRDIKPANTLIKGEYYKLADFGFATKVDVRGKNMLRDYVGSPLYMAPQLLENKPYTVKSDIWSIGLMFYEMLFGKTPWPARDIQSLKENVKRLPLRFPYDIPIGKHTKSFIEGCLQKDEDKRMDWKDLFDHPIFYTSGEIDHAQTLDPRSREIIYEIQQEVQLHNLAIEDLFNQYNHKHNGKMTFDEFYGLLQHIDKRVTSYEARHIFEIFDVLDTVGVEVMNLEGFTRLFTEYDFTDINNKAVQIINDIREIIKHNKINVFDLFDKFDFEKNGDLSLEEFTNAIRTITPKLKTQDIKLLFENFDDDHNGSVSFNEFYEHMSYGIQHLNTSYDPQKIKATKLIQQIKQILKKKQMTTREFFDLFDEDENQTLDLVEFTELMKYIDEQLPKSDIQAVYNYIDDNNDGSVQLQEFMQALE